jgi:hypothetical protein
MFSKSKIVIVPLFVALAVSMSACDRASTAERTDSGTTQTQTDETAVDNTGGMGMTYTGKMGIDMGGGLVMPMNGGMPQMGIGF